MFELEASHISYQIKDKLIIEDINIRTKNKEIVGLLGPNGSGKSTFLKTVYRVLKPNSGTIVLSGKNIEQISSKELFRQLAIVSQENHGEFEFTAMEVVMMGRYPFKGNLEKENQHDIQIVENALQQVDMWDYRDHIFVTLSGGEKQRTLIARALAQTPQYLILDEPTNHLDVHHQMETMDLLKQLGIGVLITIHDLNLAAYYCDYLYILKEGRLVEKGTPAEVLTPEIIHSVYNVCSEVRVHPKTQKLNIHFIPKVFQQA